MFRGLGRRTCARAYLLGCSSALVVGSPGIGFAQTADDATLDEVVVTGSRTIVDGANAPTPLTAISGEQLQAARPGNLAEALNLLPAFSGSRRPTSAGSTTSTGAGANILALRGIGPERTLVLLDGRRIVPSTATSTPDANLIPQGLVKRVDVVTGGASAAYGSDAVAGVVNFVLDTDFQGLKAYGQAGISTYDDAGSYKVGASWGARFLDDRLHVLASADAYRMNGVQEDFNGRDWAERGWGIIGVGPVTGAGVPPGTPANAVVVAPDVRDAQSSYGGYVANCAFTAGTPANSPCSIRGMQFLPGGALGPYAPGQYVSASTMSGGDGTPRRTNLVPEVRIESVFARAAYEVTDSLKVFSEYVYGGVRAHFFGTTNAYTGGDAFTIFADNAFLPASVRSAMAAHRVASFTLGRTARDFNSSYYNNDTETMRFVTGFEGELGERWSYSGYYEYGRSTQKIIIEDNPIQVFLYNAVDAVIDPATGRAVCRSTLAGLPIGQGCVPINLFGEGSPSAEALDYVRGNSYTRLKNLQDVYAFDVRGELFELPSGPLAVAFGIEHRREKAALNTDPLQQGLRTAQGVRGFPSSQTNLFGQYRLGNPAPLSGKFDVTEGYVESTAPLLGEGSPVGELNLNGAYRYADYSSAGGVSTWKVGAVWAPIPSLRLRATQSRDVRAPNISELFNASTTTFGLGVNDPQFGNQRVTVVRRITGNPDLGPEKADTTSFGVVFEPEFLSGFTASVDYYKIRIKDVIATPGLQDVVNGCFGGAANFCDLIVRNPNGSIQTIITPSLNQAQLDTSGIDFEASYRRTIPGFGGGEGALNVRLLATYVDEVSLTNLGTTIDRVGDYAITPSGIPSGTPEWSGTLSMDFRQGPFRLLVQERYISSGDIDKTLTFASNSISGVKATFYTDVTASYRFQPGESELEAFVTINNLFNQAPRITPNGAATAPRAANGGLYDFLGRYFTVGLRGTF